MKSNNCGCDSATHPAVIFNPPGLSVVRYRTGDFLSFREALLRPLGGEIGLRNWRPEAREDLGVQIIEWWAYLADILTFYEERSAQLRYVRTADLTESVRHLVRLLGYRPRPGIGAQGQVAALIKGPKPLTVPAGYQIQSKPGPGQTPQTFEVDATTVCSLPDSVPADATPYSVVTDSVLLAGQDAAVKVNETLLVLDGAVALAFVNVAGSTIEIDPRGNKNTRVRFKAAVGANSGAGNLRLLRSAASSPLWPYGAGTAVTASTVQLASIVRDIEPGSVVVFDKSGAPPVAVTATAATELIWYAKNSGDPTIGDTVPPIPILHTQVTFSGTINAADLQANRATTRLRHSYRDVGKVIPTPATSASGPVLALTAAAGKSFPALEAGVPVLIAGGAEDGTAGIVDVATSSELTLQGAVESAIQAPFDALFNVLPVSRGKSVSKEILGSGDAALAGQEFTLKKFPLTYLAATGPDTPSGYRSTLRLYVDGIEWKEAASFYGAGPNDRIFVTREDAENKTHVQFGDGIRGARVPTGVNNVTAYYRYESGAELPDAGKLTVIPQPLAGLRGIVNPVQPFGGADPDPAERLKQLAPKSVLTFGRAVSAADYEAIAAATPGVARAKAYWTFDSIRQQGVVTVYVGDSAGAVTAARTALAGAADSNRPLLVMQATAVPVALDLRIRFRPGYLEDDVKAALVSALTGAESGLLGPGNVRIGQTLFRSQIFEVCQAVDGVDSVASLALTRKQAPVNFPEPYRAFAGEGKFFQLAAADLTLLLEEAVNA